MTILATAISRQIDHSIYETSSPKEKLRLASFCELLKKAALVASIAVPIFAFFFPRLFGITISLITGLIGYDLFNLADNLGDAARLSARGGTPPPSQSNLDMLTEGTILARLLYEKSAKSQHPLDRDSNRS